MLLLPIIAIVVVAIVYFGMKDRDAAARARILRNTGFILMAVGVLFFGLFAVGETISDPGGWEALGLIAAWAVPLAALAAIAWFRPVWAVWVFAVLVTLLIGVAIWFAIDRDWWKAFEDRNGPIRDIAFFIVAAPVALLGLKRTAAAGVLLLVLGIVPFIIMNLGSLSGFDSLTLVLSAPVLTGILYLLSARMSGRSAPGANLGPEGQPRPA